MCAIYVNFAGLGRRLAVQIAGEVGFASFRPQVTSGNDSAGSKLGNDAEREPGIQRRAVLGGLLNDYQWGSSTWARSHRR